nr:PD-(D/E)XK nuclease family protein [Thiobacillaceae bacterium]
NDCYHLDLLDLFKSPFVFADLEAPARLDAVAELERALRRAGVAAGCTATLDLSRRAAPRATGLLQRLARARQRLGGGRRGLSAWQADLLAALEDLGVPPALAADTAGRQLLSLLQGLAREVAGHTQAYDFPTWRDWLFRQLERGSFRDDDIDSPVRLVSPQGARLRDFDAAVLLGADAAHLPPADMGGLFNDRVRAELGLPGMAERRAELRGALTDLLCHVPRVLLTWQARLDGESNPLSPWLEVLEGFHRLAYGASLGTATTDATTAARAEGTGGTARPRPRPARLPERISASGWQSLVDCPYRFHIRHILGLADAEDIPEEMEKRDYGDLVHAILHEFHDRYPRLLEVGEDVLVGELDTISARRFAPRLAGGYLALGWQMRWRRRLSAYVAWAREREASGYAWRAGEVARERDLPLDDTRHITLRGRLDRVDEGPLGEAVLDYKTRSRQDLSRRMAQPGEDVQLPFYGLLTGAAEAAYLALDETWPVLLGPSGELASLAAREAERLRATLAGALDGAALPAHGAESVCVRCEARGLCRRDYWAGEEGDVEGA